MTHARRLILFLLVVVTAGMAGGNKPQPPSASLQFLVVKDENGKPVRNAEIVMHPVDKKGQQKDAGWELKTHEDGKAAIDGIPYGTVRVQVIAPGFRTTGQDIDVSQPTKEITIKLEKPAGQYSIYK